MFLLMFLLSVFSPSASAFLIATHEPQAAIDYEKETDIFVIGYAGELGSGFLRTGATISHKSKEQYPNRQRVFFLENRDKDKTSSKYVSAMGFNLISFDSNPFTTKLLMTYLQKFKKIKAMHVVTHGALENGLGLTDRDEDGRWSYKTKNLDKLHFTDDGYIVLHGCNTGFWQAPQFSKIIGVPTFGSLTATNFQQPFDDGQWYFHDKGLYPETASFLTLNNLTFDNPVGCSSGGCYRLKADFFTYNGYWGDFKEGGGLSFLKAFCTFGNDQKKRDEKCLKAMVHWIHVFPSTHSLGSTSSMEDYKTVVKDFLCGVRLNHSWRQDCFENLELSLSSPDITYAGFRGNVLQCNNFGECDFDFSCDTPSHTCQLSAPINKKPKTIIEEYWYYMSALNTYL
ncbi:MAG: hypothetical protein IT287_00290 [Bdellovibrionaceae bacterium]|nr:hypothetical protein [Pseudobdellovibrionaceae bacterium]